MPANKPINHTPVKTRGRTRGNLDPEAGKPSTPLSPKGWTTGLPFFDVSRWSFWAQKDPNHTETKPDLEDPEKDTPEEGTLDPAMQVNPATMPRQSFEDKEPVKNEFESAPIDAFGEVPNMFSRPASPTENTDSSVYENTFDIE